MLKGIHVMNPKKAIKSICHLTTLFYIQYELM